MKDRTEKIGDILFIIFLIFGIIALISLAFGNKANGAEGSAQKDPIFKYSKNVSADNIIVRDGSGRRIGYWIKDPILDDNWIQYRFKSDPESAPKKAEPIFPRWDLDPVGE